MYVPNVQVCFIVKTLETTQDLKKTTRTRTTGGGVAQWVECLD